MEGIPEDAAVCIGDQKEVARTWWGRQSSDEADRLCWLVDGFAELENRQ